MSKFWEYVSSVSDDIRNDVRRDVVEQPWYGSPTTEPNSLLKQDDLQESETVENTAGVEQENGLYEEVWGEEPEASDLYGEASSVESNTELEVSTPDPEPEIEQDI